MGQGQLILLVLATLIVGLAIVVGIRAFYESSAKANADAIMQDAARIASDAQAWKQKPETLGGQAWPESHDAQNFTGITLAGLGYPGEDGDYANANGSFTLKGTGNKAHIVGTNTVFDNRVEVLVCGMEDSDIHARLIDVGGVQVAETPRCPR